MPYKLGGCSSPSDQPPQRYPGASVLGGGDFRRGDYRLVGFQSAGESRALSFVAYWKAGTCHTRLGWVTLFFRSKGGFFLRW